MSEEMFAEAIQAAKAGQRARARDLLTRVLKADAKNAEIWLWMSAVVDSEKEQIFCLQRALKIDPNSLAARRGLVILGAMSPEEAALPPAPTVETAAVRLPSAQAAAHGFNDWLARPRNRQMLLIGGLSVLALVVFGGLFFGLLWPRLFPKREYVVVTSTPTATNTTLPPSATPESFVSPTPTLIACQLPERINPVTPIAVYLCLTQTPTPLAVSTETTVNGDYKKLQADYRDQQWAKAIDSAQFLLTQQGFADKPLVYFYLAESKRYTGNSKEALKNYQAALKLDANLAPAHYGLALVYFDQNRQTDGLDSLAAAINADSAFYPAYLARGQYYTAVGGNAARGLADFQQAQVVAPDNPLVLAHLAVAYMDNSLPDQALSTAEQALALDLGQPLAYYARGRARYALGALDSANQDLDLAATYLLDPQVFADTYPALNALNYVKYTQAQIYFHAGLAEAASGHPDQASVHFGQALSLYSKFPQAYLGRGQAYLANQKFSEARADFNDAISQFLEIDSQNPGLNQAYLGNGLALLGLDRPESAVSNFLIVARAEPNRFDAQRYLGEAQARAGQSADAIATLTTALSLTTTPAEQAPVLYWRAQAYGGLKQSAEQIADLMALTSLAQAGELIPTAQAELTQIGPLASDTPTAATATATSAVKPSATSKPSATVKPSATPKPSATARPGLASPTAATPSGYPASGQP